MDTHISEMLSGQAGLAGVQRALLAPASLDVLRRALQQQLPPDATIAACELTRAKYKPGRHLTAYYTVRTQGESGDDARPIEVTWVPAAAADPRGEPEARSAAEDDARRRGLVAPFRQLTAEALDYGMRVQVAPLDASYPQLSRLSDPAYVAPLIGSARDAGGGDPAPARAYEVQTIRYRPDQRHVLRYSPADGPRDGTLYAKIYNSAKGAWTFRTATRLADWVAAHGQGMSVVKPWVHLRDDNVVLYPHLDGTPLSQLLGAPDGDTPAHLRHAGAVLAALHAIPTDVVDLQPNEFAKEVKGIARAAEHLQALLPDGHARIAAVLQHARAIHEQLPAEPPAFAFGDFKADHLWVTEGGMALMDCDTCYLADQAIDLGKFLADMHWWCDQYGYDNAEQLQGFFLEGYGAAATAQRLARARLYEALVLIKSTVRRVRLFDPDWAERTARLIGRAERLALGVERVA